MELTIYERLLLLNALPPAGDLTTIRIVRKLRETLSFSEAELAEHEIKTNEETGALTWRVDGSTKGIELGAKAHDIAVRALNALSDAGKVEEAHLSLFDKFGIGLD